MIQKNKNQENRFFQKNFDEEPYSNNNINNNNNWLQHPYNIGTKGFASGPAMVL